MARGHYKQTVLPSSWARAVSTKQTNSTDAETVPSSISLTACEILTKAIVEVTP